MRGLPRQFFQRGALALAPDLLGKLLVHRTVAGVTAGIIVEVEAYCGLRDPAAHSFRGPPNGRTAVMYRPGGRAYIYLIYGMHSCMNVVAGAEGDPQGVLIRALEPVEGLALMARRRYPDIDPAACMAAEVGSEAAIPMSWAEPLARGGDEAAAPKSRRDTGAAPLTKARLKGLCSGPGKLTSALGITREQYGLALWDSPLMVAEQPDAPAFEVDTSPRIGVDYAGEAAQWPYRFTVRGSPWLSKRAELLRSGK